MALRLANLDARTRRLMLDELERDIAGGGLWLSPRLSERGRRDYENLLHAAIESLNDVLLADSLSERGRLNATESRRHADGTTTEVKVPSNAADVLATDEFNRFYMRGLCRRAIEDGIPELEVYRAKATDQPRPESEAKIGQRVDPGSLLDDLRTHQGIETTLGLPPGPNSGLSVRLPQ